MPSLAIGLGLGMGGLPGTYATKLRALNPTGYWKFAEGSGTTVQDGSGNGFNGTYTAGTDLSQAGIGDGLTCATFSGTQTANVFGAGLAAAFNGTAMSFAGWAKRASWPLNYERIVRFAVDINNYVQIALNGVAGGIQFDYKAGGTLKTVTKSGMSTTDWFHWGFTINKPADRIIAYIAGSAVDAGTTALGTWAGALAVAAYSNTNIWIGSLAHSAYWAGTILTPAQFTSLATK